LPAVTGVGATAGALAVAGDPPTDQTGVDAMLQSAGTWSRHAQSRPTTASMTATSRPKLRTWRSKRASSSASMAEACGVSRSIAPCPTRSNAESPTATMNTTA